MGEALGKFYVARHFPPAAKQRMDQLVARILEAYRVSISRLDWMGEQTRAEALTKLSNFRMMIAEQSSFMGSSSLRELMV